MATTEFQARALFDFIAENSNELGFAAGEILLITSTTAGEGWWFAQNSTGQIGAVPANYIEVIYDESQPAAYQNHTDVDNNLQTEQHSTNYEPNDVWPSSEPVSWPTQQANQTNEQEITTSSSFNSISSPIINENSLNTIPMTSNTFDPYISVSDPSPPPNTVPMTLLNPITREDTASDQSDWYSDPTQTSAPVLASNQPMQNNPLSPFGYPQTAPIQQQQITSMDFIFTQPPSENDSIYDTPSTFVYPSVETTYMQPTPLLQPPPPVDLMSLDSPKPSPLAKANTDNIPTSPPAKPKSEKTKFFTLKRSKTKSEPEKRSLSMESPSEQISQPAKHGSDSDDFSDSGQMTQENLKSKPSTGGSDAKGTPRARFFDKHGIDNYILHGCKAKSDEHVEIAFDEKQGGVCWSNNPSMPPFTCKVEDPAKGTKLGGLKSFMEYKIHAQIPGSRVVSRRYKQFDWLHEQLANKYRFICVPQLPGKQIAGRFEQEFIEERRRQLELWLNRICQHPVLCASFPVQHFVTCELTEKNNKDWKSGKRKVEKDELREASWLHCVTFTNSNLTDAQIATQIETFAQQQPGLETHLKNLSQGFTKYLERHTEIYERDIQRIAELFSKLHTVVQVDTTTPGNQDLSSSISKISSSYNGIAELYKTKASEGIRDFNERVQEYIGRVACFPLILSIHRSGADFMRTAHQRGQSTTPDFNSVLNRSQVLNYVVLAEINFFQREKVTDLNSYMKTLLNQQIQFYEKITSEIRDALLTFG